MASVLVVGASSDVAHRLIPELLAAGHTVTGLAGTRPVLLRLSTSVSCRHR
ncbi:MAG: hypothetical protein CM15mP128_2080 [Methanobacteriota archaeon]|nr:MAG: hypothetical protein CM15mP128_2080 [Euryarchaeota archaeon]